MIDTEIYSSKEAEKRIMEVYDRALAKWPVPHTTTYVDTSIGSTFVIVSGDPESRPMILLHGSGSNSLAWGEDVVDYSKHYHVFAIDITGEPGKSSHTRLGWDGAAHSIWLGEVINGLGIDKCVIVGMSLGGWIALSYSVTNPDRVAKLVLVCTSGIVNVRLSYVMKLIFFSLSGTWGKKKLKQLFFGRTEIKGDAAEFFELCMQYFTYRQGAPSLVSDAELSRLTMPVLFVGGEHDAILDTRMGAARLARHVPHATIRILKNLDHVLIHTAPEIIPFLL
jgi:pimeloyl-ACP methyl ester carboxylesterase